MVPRARIREDNLGLDCLLMMLLIADMLRNCSGTPESSRRDSPSNLNQYDSARK
jgi:hypothetical protein